MTELEQTGDATLDSVLGQEQTEMQAVNNTLLADIMVKEAIHNACDFFGLPEIAVVNGNGMCICPNNTETLFDDTFGSIRKQMIEMGISGVDSLTLVCTHECAHWALQNYEGIEGKSKELACDFFVGVHSVVADIDVEQFSDSLGQTMESTTHPSGELRAEAVEQGRYVAEDMVSQGIPVTFENCIERFDDFLSEHPDLDSVGVISTDALSPGYQVSFGAAYSAEEYVEKANNCYKEAEYYEDKAARSDDKYEIKHNMAEARKWRQRGDEYMQKAKFATK